MSELLTSEDFDDAQKIRSEKALRRWRSACSDLKNRRRVLRKLDDLDEHLELQELFRAASVAVKAELHFTESLGLPSNEDVTEARRFHETIQGVGSTVSGHGVTVFDTIVPQFNFQASNYASLMSVIVSYIKICALLGKYKKRALAVFYVVLEAASLLLDIFGKSKRSILLAAFLLSASGFAITMSMPTCIVGRIRAAARTHIQKLLLVVLEISFSVVQLFVTFMYFILAELGVKHKFNASVFPLVFAVIAAAFTFKYDGEVSDSSGLASRHLSPVADNQVHMPNNTRNEDAEANGSMPMQVIVTSHD
ncbi:hypothetical protein CISIN_1g021812mg [Citrus sinensis]|uniref:Uncharacterized protein n=2 Tax=Citrus TaxID=2706 RepID=A0A067EDT8_CITSI|nr:hypothetical protein CISIN_1g021812mg [Citrus sinensis]